MMKHTKPPCLPVLSSFWKRAVGGLDPSNPPPRPWPSNPNVRAPGASRESNPSSLPQRGKGAVVCAREKDAPFSSSRCVLASTTPHFTKAEESTLKTGDVRTALWRGCGPGPSWTVGGVPRGEMMWRVRRRGVG